MVSAVQTISYQMTGKIMNWEGYGRKWLSPNLKYYTIPAFTWRD
jgi:hypothetical protein